MPVRYPRIFSPGRLGRLTAKNRLVLPPMVRNYADENGRATPRYVAHIERIARGGVGTVILEASYVRADGKGFTHQLGLHDDSVVAPLRSLVEVCHRHGTLAGIQLYHGGRQASAAVSGHQPVAPSAIPDPVVNELPHALDTAGIQEIVRSFGAAARRAKDAGCDFVEIHAAHGYLIAEFLSAFSNRRSDSYGGSPENRRRFLEEVFAAVRQAVGPEYPVTVRLSGEENCEGGVTLAQARETARCLEKLGVAAIHVSSGNYATYAQGHMIPPMAVQDGILRPLAAGINDAVNVPVIAVGKLRTPEMIESVLENQEADFVALGRSLLADPDWPRKLQEGRGTQIRPCIACNQGCIGRLFAQLDVHCTVNPEAGHEAAYAAMADGAGRKLLVAGSGPAGLEAAHRAALAGFSVSVFESEAEPGGQLLAASAAPLREGWAELRRYLLAELRRLKVHLHVNSPVTGQLLERERPWAVVLATGSVPVRSRFGAAEGMKVVSGRDVLEGRVAPEGKSVVVVGGGCSGAQTAEYLAARGLRVTLLEATAEIAPDAPIDDRNLLLTRLAGYGVVLRTGSRMLGLDARAVLVESAGRREEIPADMLILCLGSTPVRELEASLVQQGCRYRVAGDANRPRKVTEAVAEGAQAVLELSAGA